MAATPRLPRLVVRILLALLCLVAACNGSSPATSGGGDDAAVITDDAGAPAPDAAVAGDATPADDAAPAPDATPPLCSQTPTGQVSLPADDAGHSELMEWWYWTGHLVTADGRWFGFEETFFKTLTVGVTNRAVHAAVTDIGANQFHYATNVALAGNYTAVTNGFDLEMSPQTAIGGDGHDTLHTEVDGWTVDLTVDAVKAPTLQNGVGYTTYSFGGYTYYYSRERMTATGTIANGSAVYPVTGTAWFDHQYGDISHAVTLGWDWFAFQLDDDREIMIFVVRNGTQQLLVGGSFTDAGCVPTEIGPTEFTVTSTGTWKSPRTGCTYPSGWTVTVKGLTFTVTPAILDQEVSSAIPIYWEGASLVTGDATGRAYVELAGYCP